MDGRDGAPGLPGEVGATVRSAASYIALQNSKHSFQYVCRILASFQSHSQYWIMHFKNVNLNLHADYCGGKALETRLVEHLTLNHFIVAR